MAKRLRWSVLLSSLPIVVLASSTIATVPAQESTSARIDGFVCDEMLRQKVPGVAVAVVQRGAVIKAQGYGVANLEHQVPVESTTIFQSGSLGKQFTAAAVMLLVEDGKLSLSDPITKFFPDAPHSWRAITVRHLLTHTSGIPDYSEGTVDLRKDHTEDSMVRFAFGLRSEFPPGSRWNYSNTGYVLLGAIVRRVSGSFYGDILTVRVFKPLGMSTARVISESDIVPHRAAGYRLEKGEIKNQEWVAPLLNTTADGSLYFSIKDLLAWDAAVRARSLLRQDSWNSVLQPVRLTSGKSYPYGFGWRLDERNGEPLWHHGGSWQGFKTYYSRFTGDDLSIIVLANLAQAVPERFVDGIAEILNPRLGVPALRSIEDREPTVTTRLSRLLDDARAGRLNSRDFSYMRAGFFPAGAKAIADQLRDLGAVQNLLLVDRTEKGDDRIYTYEVQFSDGVRYYVVGLAPDNRISQLQLRVR